jgi:hypothetical protein
MRIRWLQHTLAVIVMISTFAAGIFQPTAEVQAQQPPQPPIPGQVSVSPEGDKISIYVSDLDGGDERRVVSVDMALNHPLFGDFVSLSPDGHQVLYVTADNSALFNAEFWAAQVDGSGVKRIALFPEGLWSAAPVWSPDGTRIAYCMKRPDSAPGEGLQLWVMDSDGSHQQLVAEDGALRPSLFDQVPQGVIRWSADGSQLEFVDRWSSPPYLYRVDLDTATITKAETSKEPELMRLLAIQNITGLPCAVPTYNQHNYSNLMRTCNRTISQAGCALTSAAMVLKYYGVRTDPPTLNSCLGNRACPLWWGPVASSCSERKVSGVAFKQGFSYTVIDQYLAAGKPVIVWVRTRTGGTHFVVVNGGSGRHPGGYTINDPADGSSNKTLAHYTNTGWYLAQINRYSGTPSCSGGGSGSDPDGGSISYGDTKGGAIRPAHDFDDFYFNAAAGDIVEIRQNKLSSSFDPYVVLYGPDGRYVAHNDDGGGNRNAFLRRTLSASGRYRIRAKGWGSTTGAYTLRLTKVASGGCGGDCEGDRRWISFGRTLNGTISPNNDLDTYYFRGTAGRIASIRMNRTSGGLDPYLELWSPNGVKIKTNDDGGGYPNSWLVKRLPSSGTYRIIARSYARASSGTYSIKLESLLGSGNLARGRRVRVSSVEFRGVEGWKATDGNLRTRWSSRFSDPQWIYVDLGRNRTFNQVRLKWETAYGRRFGIYYWTGRRWRNVYWTNYGRGGTNTINFSPRTARYVMMWGVQRGTPWGYSLWEFEVYDTSTATVPEVPPGDPGKPPDTTEDVAPLPPTEGDKEVMLSGDGEFGQEETPLSSPGDALTVTQQTTSTQSVVAFINSPSELDGLFTPEGYVRFEGVASSEVSTGTLEITDCHWRSDRNGDIGSQLLFTVPVTSLLPGEHMIYFKAQNEWDDWSEEVTTTLTVEWPHQVHLPLILK